MKQSDLIIPVYGAGMNLAPVKPLLDLRENRPPSHYLCDALKERFKHFIKQDETARDEMLETGRIVDEFIQGRQIFGVNPYNGEIRALPVRRHDNSTRRAISLMQFFESLCERKWMDSNPDVRIRPGANNDNAIASARGAGEIVDHYEELFFTDNFNRREGALALRWGTYINRVRHDPGIKGITTQREVIEAVPITFGEGSGYCADCKYAGAASEFQPMADNTGVEAGGTDDSGMIGAPMEACPSCGSLSVVVQPAPTVEVPNVTGMETVELGDLRLDTLAIPACYWDLAVLPEDSGHFIYRQRIPLGEIHRLIGNVAIPSTGGKDGDKGLDILESLQRAGMAMSGKSAVGREKRMSGAWQDRVTLDEMWLSPADYADITLQGDEETVGGQPIPAGSKLVKVFPDGLVAVGLNQMNLVLGLYAEKHKDHIATGVWHMRPHSGAGRGVVDAVEVQMRLNKYDNQVSRSLDASTPGGFYDARIVSGDEVALAYKPGKFVPVDLDKLPPENRNIGNAVFTAPVPNLSGAVIGYGQQFLREMMQFAFGIMDFSDGLPGVKNSTLGGAQISQALSESVFTPILKTKSGVRKRIAQIVVDLYRKHFPVERWIPASNKYGARSGLLLQGADLSKDIIFEVVRDSESPRNTFTRRTDSERFFMVFGGFPAYLQHKQQFPAEVRALERAWNITLDLSDDYDVIALRCGERMDVAEAAVKMGAVMPQEIIPFLIPPLSVAEPRHLEKAKWFSDWLDTDEGAKASPVLRDFAAFMAEYHVALDGQQKGGMMAAQMAGMPPPPMSPDGEPQAGPPQQSQPQSPQMAQAV